MLFNIDNDYLLNEYFNFENNKPEIVNPKDGLILGNMFYNSYIPYKDYKPCEYVACNEKEKLLLRIQELTFALNDLGLYLDLDPKDEQTYNLFKIYANELNKCKKKYTDQYEVLELNEDIKTDYTWYKNPWPWEGDSNV